MSRFSRRDTYLNFHIHLLLVILTVSRNIQIEAIKNIANEDISKYLLPLNDSKSDRPVCSLNIYDPAHSNFNHSTVSVFSEDLHSLIRTLNLNRGGEWEPEDCAARFFVAIIIPYRDREINLSYFIRYIHPFLQTQKIHYRIYLIEQTFEKRFNKGSLNNIGFIEALKDRPFPCFIFHDVNKVPINLNNIYACTEAPRHMAVARSSTNYKLPFSNYFGGVLSFTPDQYRLTNGFSNKFYGWGGEDDDLYTRVVHAGLEPVRFDGSVSTYLCLARIASEVNEKFFAAMVQGKNLYNFGLNTVNYTIISRSEEPLFTRIVVQLNEEKLGNVISSST